MKKALSVVLCFALVFGMFAGFGVNKAEAAKGNDESEAVENARLYDSGRQVREQANDEEYREEQYIRLKEMAEDTDLNGLLDSSNEESNFTFEGPTKIFAGYDPIYGDYLKTYTLRSIGENVEVWVADDLAFHGIDEEGNDTDDPFNRPTDIITQEHVDRMRDVFDSTVYPKDTEFFGMPNSHTGENAMFSEWGIDEYTPESYIPEGYEIKERVMILVDNIRDERYYDPDYPNMIAGFYSGTFQDYFDRNIISIDSLNWDEYLETNWLPTTAHEFQHLIHDDNDPMEESWINEGMSDYAEYLCLGSYNWGHINYFLEHPENSLVEWDDQYDAAETIADYGQALLMQIYLNDKYGQDFVRALALDGEDQGIDSVNKILDEFNTHIDFEELFRRFTIAVAIDSGKPGNGIYEFDSIDIKVDYESALEFDKDGVPAWGGDYKVIDFADKIENITFDGMDFLPVPWQVVSDPLGSEEQVFWGNEGDYRDNFLIFEADLTGVNEATLHFDNYIDIEEDWDAGAVQVSTDNGETWMSLANENTVGQDTFPLNEQAPYIYENLPAFTGYYEEWTQETFDLSQYVGQNIHIAFRYMTDGAYNDSGWFIDNISIPEIGYSNDCSELDAFIDLNRLTETFVEYAVTFINEETVGKDKAKYKVINVDPFNVNEDDALQLRQLFKDGTNYMIVWFAPPAGTKGAVDFTYEITIKSDNNKNKKNK